MRKLPFILVSGGCRSGKSAYAEQAAKNFSADCLYIATAEISDEEMRQRVLLHRQSRGEGWRLHESSPDDALNLWRQLPTLIRQGEALLFDCLTLWVASCMRHEPDGKIFPCILKNCFRLCGSLIARYLWSATKWGWVWCREPHPAGYSVIWRGSLHSRPPRLPRAWCLW